jgi:hypothetical protein
MKHPTPEARMYAIEVRRRADELYLLLRAERYPVWPSPDRVLPAEAEFECRTEALIMALWEGM